MAARTHTGSRGSTTTTVLPTAVVHIVENPSGLLGSPTPDTTVTVSERRVSWDKAAIDNENMNKKKSKKCCIFHKRRDFGESSSDSDSDSSSDAERAHGTCGQKCDSERGINHCKHHDPSNTPAEKEPKTPSES
ncbi:protein phosphatase inhibitor protein [Toxoplasma gondii ME49]|uniref:Protein phosphatase inhibitor protein n=2 Tax=Toxoplasma gondii TaxID=5811 RepID=S8GFG5_TOXGM|nr:protein phosphatase inhibitor protein [Toxoplasma gondii ME49]EPT27179.1 protein phosphatase inhibitor protein [Toxoplasma gondii ME49]KYF43339.1 protein phosphatase inhibitor protein [Toxoplasma gondii ARI]|eukprot:XP_018636046.1 protein phosphatase inhibitor protein [Toxoplasma gondii ME49]